MVSVRVIFGAFLSLFYFLLVFSILGGVFNKTTIPLALVGYETIIANIPLHDDHRPAMRAKGYNINLINCIPSG